MKKIVVLAVVAACLFRLVSWRGDYDRALSLCSRLQADPSRGQNLTIVGSPALLSAREWIVEEARVNWQGEYVAFSGEVRLTAPLPASALEFGRSVRIVGPFHCPIPLRNPGKVEDGLLVLRPPRLSGYGSRFKITVLAAPATWLSRAQSGLRAWLFAPFAGHPALEGFMRAVWTGDLTGLSEPLRLFYKETGLLQLLALSGQHVGCLVLLAAAALRAVGAPLLFFLGRGRGAYCRVSAVLPLFCALVLFVVSQGNPPVRRTLAMTAALFLLRARGFECSPLQITTSSVALLILSDPALVCSPGFFLSAAATALLCEILSGNSSGRVLRTYLFLSACMPVLLFPYSAFFFCKVSLLAPLSTLLLAWFWELILIPFGFLCPFLILLLPSPVTASLLRWLDRGWISFQQWHLQLDPLRQAYVSVVRPGWGELLVIETMLLIVILAAKRRVFSSPL